MKFLRRVKSLSEFENGVVATIGNFDGVHLGHQNLIKSLKYKALSMNLPVVLILFEPQPREYFQKEKAPARISSLREKLDVLRQCQVDYVYLIKFDKKLAQTAAADFARSYFFDELKVKYLLVGEDFQFGKNREGNYSLLKELGHEHDSEVEAFKNFCISNERVSSTKIRTALSNNDFELATKFLGRAFSLCGRVIQGDGRGRQWGIPTANLGMHRLSLPLKGVFVVQVLWGAQTHYGVANIGTRPTLDGVKNILEVHLFHFNNSLYGELIQVLFLHKLRDEVKFTSVDALITQIHKDVAEARAFLNLLPE